jgi:hypothetical protein
MKYTRIPSGKICICIAAADLKESHVQDVISTKKTPNYRLE